MVLKYRTRRETLPDENEIIHQAINMGFLEHTDLNLKEAMKSKQK